MKIARGDSDGVGEAADGDGSKPIDSSSVAELSEDVSAPAARSTIGNKGTGVITTCGNGDGVDEVRDRDGSEPIVLAIVPELSEAVVAPASYGAVVLDVTAVI